MNNYIYIKKSINSVIIITIIIVYVVIQILLSWMIYEVFLLT